MERCAIDIVTIRQCRVFYDFLDNQANALLTWKSESIRAASKDFFYDYSFILIHYHPLSFHQLRITPFSPASSIFLLSRVSFPASQPGVKNTLPVLLSPHQGPQLLSPSQQHPPHKVTFLSASGRHIITVFVTFS